MAKSLRTKTEAQSNLRLRLSSNVSAGIRVVSASLGAASISRLAKFSWASRISGAGF
jgi:hypothetical protein